MGYRTPTCTPTATPSTLRRTKWRGRWKAGQFGDLKRDATYFEAAFDARLAHRLNALGYATQKKGYSFEVAGTPQSLIDKFSRRRDEIERKAAEKGVTDAEGKHAIGYYGREHIPGYRNHGLPAQRRRAGSSAGYGESFGPAHDQAVRPPEGSCDAQRD